MASDLLIVYDNAADRATITATNTSGTTAASNMGNDIKGKIHRSTSNTTIEYKLTWGNIPQTIGAVVLPMTNLSTAATMQVIAYSDSAWTSQAYTSGAASTVFSYSDIGIWNGYVGSGTANEFGTGRYSSGYLIFDTNYTNIKSLKITIASNNNGVLIDCARIVAGRAWRPNRYASNGIQFTVEDTAQSTRTNSGNVVLDTGFKSNNMSFDIKYLDETDRTELIKILKLVGSTKNIFVSVFPSTASRLKDDYSVYGRVAKSPITYEVYSYYTYNVSIEGW